TVDASANAVASILVVLAIPFLGALSDVRRRRKPWVVGFTLLSCAACAAMGVLGQRLLPLVGTSVDHPAVVAAGWHAAGAPLFWVLAAFVVASFGYQAAQPFYNAMLPELVPVEEQGRLSGFGTAVGYVGSIVGVMLVAPFFSGALPLVGKLGPGALGALHRLVPYTEHGGRVSTFLPTGLLFLLFSLPLSRLSRSRPSAEGHAGRLAARRSRSRAHDPRRAPASRNAALHHRVVRLPGRNRNDRRIHDAVR